jgi:NodT family efflux transporter outer membrane factor (OMF) lipoprotein
LKDNLGLKQALSRIDEARAVRGQAAGLRTPGVSVGASAGGSRVTETGVRPAPENNPTDFYKAGIASTWELDFFGRVRRLVESSQASLDASVEAYRNVRVVLAAEVASEYVVYRTLIASVNVAKRNTTRQQKTLDLAQRRFNAGVVSRLDISQAAYTLALTESLIPKLEADAELSRNRLTFLMGKYPGALTELLNEPVDPPRLHFIPDTGLPRNLLRRRPDIRRQERLLAAQTARIGAAKADLYPRFDLQGFLGISTISTGNLFDAGSGTWLFGLPISWNIFSGGRLQARVAQEEARTHTALIAYQETVLSAITEVEGFITSGAKLLEYRKALEKALAETKVAGKVVWTQYENGVVDFQRVLDVERNLLSVENNLVESNGALMQTLVGLYRALGGGWSPEYDPLMDPNKDRTADTS